MDVPGPLEAVCLRALKKDRNQRQASAREFKAEIDAVIELAAGRENILLGTGAIPYETPVENLMFMKEYCSE